MPARNCDTHRRSSDYKLNFSPKSEDDWTLAVHHLLQIKRRTCTTFIPESTATGNGQDEVRCGCNRLRREHSWEVVDGTGEKWEKDVHTQSACNNAYGYMPNNASRYIRCDVETEPRQLVELMFTVWKMTAPRLIMSIIGGAKYFKLNERLEREFIKGIIQAALKADGWIVTTGFKTGVVQLVGEAIHDHKVTNPGSQITAIGCSKWGACRHRQSLIIKNGSTTANRHSTKVEKGEQSLEPNHTHFLLLDDGKYYDYETNDYRTRLVKEISSYQDPNVAMVTIVVEGGPDTLVAIYNDLRNDIPVVVIDGSGRVPNLLADFLRRTQTMLNRNEKKLDETPEWKGVVDISEYDKLRSLFFSYEEDIRNGLKQITKGSKQSEEALKKLLGYFLYCLQPAVRTKIQVFSLDGEHDLDDTIFQAIIQAKQKKDDKSNTGLYRYQLLQLALAWDALAVAKEHIIKDDLNDLSLDGREKLMFEALLLDRSTFVRKFIRLNFDLSQIFYEKHRNGTWRLKWEQLKKLYNEHHKDKKERLYLLSKCHGKPEIALPDELDRLLRRLIGDYMKPIYSQCPEENHAGCCRCLRRVRVSDSRLDLLSADGDVDEPRKEVNELIYRDLFLWSILTNRIEMAKVFLNQMQTRICACLIASKIFKSYLAYASDNESKEVLELQANQFEVYAGECLKSCYNYDEETACEIAIRSLDLFGGVTCLQVAVDADDKLFVGQPCCDQLLNNIWYDKMEPFQSTMGKRLRLLLSIGTFGLLAPLLITFREEHVREKPLLAQPNEMRVNETDVERRDVNPRKTKRLNDSGINYSDRYSWESAHCSKSFITYLGHLKFFHQSPIVKYSCNSASYLVFLLLFSYYLLFNFNMISPDNPMIHWTEIIVIITVSSMLIEEIRQFLCQDNRSLLGKLSNYFAKNNFFNWIRVASYLLFYIGLVLRFQSTGEIFSAAKIVLAYDLEVWFIRSLAFLGIAQKMGPKLVMIRRMTVDLFFFTYIILVAMVAYGVASRTMYNYNNQTIAFDGRSIFRNILYPTYYLMYGSLGTEFSGLDANPDSSTSIATHVLLAFHMLFVNILLINLLIAMFSFTFESVQTQTDLIWRYERYSLIREYFDRPPLFPPFILATHLLEAIRLLLRQFPQRKRTRTRIFKMIAAHRHVDQDWSEFESYATNLYVRSLLTGQPVSVNALIPAGRRQEAVSATESKTAQPSPNFDAKSINEEMISMRKALLDLRTQSQEMNRCMLWMMEAMDRVKMSKDPKPRVPSVLTTDP